MRGELCRPALGVAPVVVTLLRARAPSQSPDVPSTSTTTAMNACNCGLVLSIVGWICIELRVPARCRPLQTVPTGQLGTGPQLPLSMQSMQRQTLHYHDDSLLAPSGWAGTAGPCSLSTFHGSSMGVPV